MEYQGKPPPYGYDPSQQAPNAHAPSPYGGYTPGYAPPPGPAQSGAQSICNMPIITPPAPSINVVQTVGAGSGNAHGGRTDWTCCAVLVCLCCCPFPGIIAIILAIKANTSFDEGRVEEGVQYTRWTRWAILATVLTAIVTVVILVPVTIYMANKVATDVAKTATQTFVSETIG